MKTIRRPISILLAILMVVGMFTMVPISAGAETVEYFIAGSMNSWTVGDANYKLDPSLGNAEEQGFADLSVDANTELKIVKVVDGDTENNLSWYPVQNNFVLNDKGTYDIYFRPNGGGNVNDGWVEGYVYATNFRAPVYVAQIGETKYETLEAAFAAAVDGDTITVLADCAGNGIKVTPAGKFATGLTVDFGGHTYTVDGETVGSAGTETLAFQLLKNNKVTFKNGTIYSEKAKMLVQNYCDLTLDNMTLTLNNTSYNGAYTLSNNNGNTVIKDTTINANPTTGSFAFDVCRYSSYPSVDVTVTGTSVINGDVEIYASKGQAKDGFSLTLESGTMTGDIVVDPTAQSLIGEDNTITKAADFNQAAPADFKWVDNGDGTSSLAAIPYVAQIGTTKYETLAAAIDATQAGDTVKLVADVTEKVIISGKDFTLDLNGFNITSTTKNQPIDARDGTKLVITNTNEDKAENTATQNAIMGPSGGNNNGSLIARGEGTEVVINAGYYYGYNGNKTAIHAINDATIIINDCTVNGAQGIGDTTAGKEGKVFYSGLSNPTKPTATSPGTIIVHGGNFSGRMSDSNWGNYIIDGGTFDRNEVVLNENPVDEQGNRVATASSSMATLPDSPGTLDEAGWLVDGFLPVDNGDGTYTVEGPYAAQIGTTNYATLEDAFADAVDGDTITVLADSAGNGIKVPQGKFSNNGLTVDFDGHTYTVDGNTVGSAGTETLAFQLLKDNKVTFENGAIYSEVAKMLINNYCDLTLDEMTLTLNNTSYDGAYTLSNNNGSAVINDTTINANPTTGSFAFDVCRYSSYPSIDVTVTGDSVINGDVEISASKGQAKDGFSLTLESGTMTGDIVLAASAETAMNAAPEKVSVTKAAGFDQEAPEGYMWVDTATEGVQTIAKAVAQIGTTNYATLEAAFAAAVDGDTITVLADCAGNGIKVTPAGKFATGLTVDFGGYTYTVDGETVGSPGTETLAFQLLKDNKVTFKNGTIYSEKAKMLVQNYCDLTLDNMNLTLNNTSYNGAYTLSNNNGNTVIKDTTINANPTTGSFAFDVCRYSSYPSVSVKVTGDSEINGDVEIYASKGQAKDGFSLTLESGTMTGDIVVAPSAATAMAAAPDKASVNKKNSFEQDPAEGYKWRNNGDGTSTLVKIPNLFTGHNITLRGDVSLNFFINTAAIDNYDASVPAKVVFTYDGTRTAEVDFADATPVSDGVIMATIQVPAAFMAHQIHAVVYYDGEAQTETDDYSIQQYAEELIKDPAAYGIPAAKVEAVKTLMKEMLNYGAKAQTVFAGQVNEQAAYDDLAMKYGYVMTPVTAEKIQFAIDNAPENRGKTATDLSTVKPEANATFYTASVVFLSESTLKIVFKVPGGSTIAGQYDGSQKNTYYWVQEKDIAAAELDALQTFTVGDATFYYSALDYAKVVLNNGNAAAKDLVSALYLYNQAANVFFAD